MFLFRKITPYPRLKLQLASRITKKLREIMMIYKQNICDILKLQKKHSIKKSNIRFIFFIKKFYSIGSILR